MELPYNIFVYVMAFIGMLPLMGYAFRFTVPISLFFFLSAVFMISVLLATDTIIMDFFLDGDSNNNLVYNVPSGTGSDDVRLQDRYIYGENAQNSASVLVGEEINCIQVNLRKLNSPPVNTPVIFGVFDNSGLVKQEFGRMNVTALSSSFTPYKHCLTTGTYTIVTSDVIGVQYFSGDATNRVQIFLDGFDPFDGTNTVASRFSNTTMSWIDNSGADVTGVFSLETATSALVQAPFDFTFTGPNYSLKVIMIFIAVMLMLGGALIEIKQRN